MAIVEVTITEPVVEETFIFVNDQTIQIIDVVIDQLTEPTQNSLFSEEQPITPVETALVTTEEDTLFVNLD